MYEYKVDQISIIDKDLESELNQLASEGWEVTQVLALNPSSVTIISKRSSLGTNPAQGELPLE